MESIVDQVVGRLAGDQRGAVLDALVSEGMMEVLLSIIQGNASSSANSRTAESSLALLLLADLSAGSERAKVRRDEAIGEMLFVHFFFFVVLLYVRYDDRYREFHCMPVGHPFSRASNPFRFSLHPLVSGTINRCFGFELAPFLLYNNGNAYI